MQERKDWVKTQKNRDFQQEERKRVMEASLSIFSFVTCDFDVTAKKSLPHPMT